MFSGESILGYGVDEIGPFLQSGSYRLQDGRVSLVKSYLGRHSVDYVGLAEEGRGIWGFWALSAEFGQFHIQPRPNWSSDEARLRRGAESWLMLARELGAQGKGGASRDALEQAAASVDESDPDELNGVAWWTYALEGDLDVAERHVRKALELANSPESNHTLACILTRRQKWAELWPVYTEWLHRVRPSRVKRRWGQYFLPMFRELVAAGQSETAADLLGRVPEHEFWRPLYHALRGATSNAQGLFESLEPRLRRLAEMHHEQLVGGFDANRHLEWPEVGDSGD